MDVTPRRWYGRAVHWTVLAVMLLGVGFTWAQDPPVTDESVDAAVQKAIARIQALKNKDGNWEPGGNSKDRYWAGNTSLALLSLLYAGANPRDDDVDRQLSWLSAQTLNSTYCYGVRAHALALISGRKFSSRLQDDLNWLIKAVGQKGGTAVGAYDYEAITEADGRWDNSNSQFGVLGVWMATENGLTVPDSYWEQVAEHWLHCQNQDGGWTYEKSGDSRGTMTAAGVASLLVALDQRYAGTKEAGPLVTSIERGLDYISRQYSPKYIESASEWMYYHLYGIERVGRASGYKYFADKDWFRTGAVWLMKLQNAEGGWSGGGDMTELRNSCFGLMFLCHGRAPLVFNKLQYSSDWNNRLRDVAGVTRFASRAFERLLNWQIVKLDGKLDDLLEAPVLYMCGDSKWTFSDVEMQKIKDYCDHGGMVLMVDGKPDEFRKTFDDVAERAFSQFPMRPIGREHPLLSGEVQFEIKDPPPIFEINNGVRTLVLYVGKDVAASWNKPLKKDREPDFHLAGDIYMYATDKTTFRSRLQTPTIEPKKVEIKRRIKVARLKYGAEKDRRWDPEPYGWRRLKAYMNNEAAALLTYNEMPLTSADLKEYTIAYITGTEAFTLSAEEKKALRQFLSGGGTLLADAAGGSPAFTKALETQVKEVTLDTPKLLPPDSFLLTGKGLTDGVDLGSVTYRRAARSLAKGQKYPRLFGFQSRKRYTVIYSPLDLTTALLGTPVYNVQGYEPDSALQIMRNLLLYADLSPADKAGIERSEK